MNYRQRDYQEEFTAAEVPPAIRPCLPYSGWVCIAAKAEDVNLTLRLIACEQHGWKKNFDVNSFADASMIMQMEEQAGFPFAFCAVANGGPDAHIM